MKMIKTKLITYKYLFVFTFIIITVLDDKSSKVTDLSYSFAFTVVSIKHRMNQKILYVIILMFTQISTRRHVFQSVR